MEKFIFASCQNGMERHARDQILHQHPELRLAFSRPGFMTFKLVQPSWPERFQLLSPLVRTAGWSIDAIRNDSLEKRLDWAVGHIDRVINDRVSDPITIHVWRRDPHRPGDRGFEPGPDEQVAQVVAALRQRLGNSSSRVLVNRNARADQRIHDLILVDPSHWFWGQHDAITKTGRWVGGVPHFDDSVHPISRAYYKLAEALLWSGIHIRPGDICVEIGSSPGGACQRLLELGARVIAVDPAELAPELANHPDVLHLRKRGHELRKQEVVDARWLAVDVNITPAAMLKNVFGLLDRGYFEHVRAMLLTLKLAASETRRKRSSRKPKSTESGLPGPCEVPNLSDLTTAFEQRGFRYLRLRQLAFNRNEMCLLAARDKFAIRSSRKKRRSTAKPAKPAE